MSIPEAMNDSVREFQGQGMENNDDYLVLLQQKNVLEKKLLERQFFTKQLQLLYLQLDKTRNYQEFEDVLMNSRQLLIDIFTLEGQTKRSYGLTTSDVNIDWCKFGLDIYEYVTNDDELLSLYNDGLLL